jgi:hypothetical protein
MKAGPKEQQIRMLGPTGIQRQLGSPLKAGYSEAKPATKQTVTQLRKSVTAKLVTADKSVTQPVTGKRGPKPKGEAAMSQAERAKAYRARKKIAS